MQKFAKGFRSIPVTAENEKEHKYGNLFSILSFVQRHKIHANNKDAVQSAHVYRLVSAFIDRCRDTVN